MTRSSTLSLVAAFLALGSTQSFAQAAPTPESTPDWSLTGNAGLFSEYRFRGISQTNKKPAFQGGFDVAHKSGFYVGNWNSNVDSLMYNGASLEMDFYGGYKGAVDAFSYDVGALYYYYPGSGSSSLGTPRVYNTELYVAGGWGPVSLKYSYAVRNFFSAPDSKGAYYLDGTVTYPFTKEFSLIGHLGYQGGLKNGARIPDTSGPQTSITDWKLGVTYDLSGWVLGAAYIDTNRDFTAGTAAQDNRNIAGSTLVLSVTKSF